MAKNKAIYAPGELAKLRDNLGELDNDEAMRIARKLGGEVGYERTEDQEAARRQPKRVRNETMEVAIGGRRAFRRVELADDEEERSSGVKRIGRREDPNDDPSKSLKANYWERVKIDKYMAQIEFAIKSSGQVLVSMLSFFGDPADMVSPSFVNRKMNEYYRRIELMVTSVRTLLPRNNLKRNEQLKRISPFAFAILDTMRYWNIDQISGSLTKIQARPRNVKVQDLAGILREIYRPLYVLENLDPETHIKGAFKMLYKVLHLENPVEAKDKCQELIRSALVSYGIVRKDIRFQLYPLLMKLLSERFIPYELFFSMRKNRIRDFLQVTETSRISPNMENTAMAEDLAEEAKTDEETDGPDKEQAAGEEQESVEGVESAVEEPEEKAKKQHHESEKKALERGLFTLEALFPAAGWQNIQNYPDMYPYFSNVFKFKKGIELIAPTDPLQQAVVLMRILEELFFGLRYAAFGAIAGSEGPEHIGEPMGQLINEWQKNIETSLDKEYMPRLNEYCRLLENKAESRTSSYARRLLNELHWIKRLYFLPYYRFESIMPPPFQKNAVAAIYPGVRHIRRYLTAVASGIDQGNRQGGAEKRAPCDGIDNPWEPYLFQVPNPVSVRLDALLSPKKRNNASLIFFSLAVAVVLDHLLNNEDSWAYNEKNAFLFRSENGEGIRPLFGVDDKVDAEALFQQALKKRHAAAVQAARTKANGG